MFIERLGIDDVKYFIKNYFKGFEIINFRNNKSSLEFELSSSESKSTLKFIVTDFSCAGLNFMARCGEDIANKKWNEYLTDKFGKEYVTEKLNYVKNIRSNDIVK